MSEPFWQVANAVLDIFEAAGMRPAVGLTWLTTPCDDLGADTPVERIERQDTCEVLAAARLAVAPEWERSCDRCGLLETCHCDIPHGGPEIGDE